MYVEVMQRINISIHIFKLRNRIESYKNELENTHKYFSLQNLKISSTQLKRNPISQSCTILERQIAWIERKKEGEKISKKMRQDKVENVCR